MSNDARRASPGCPLHVDPLEGRRLLAQMHLYENRAFDEGVQGDWAAALVHNDAPESKTFTVKTRGTAEQGVDFTVDPTTLTLAPGETKGISLTGLPDDEIEGIETIELYLEEEPTASQDFWIIEYDAWVRVDAADSDAAETPAGAPPNPGKFAVTRNEITAYGALDVTVQIGGTATRGTDYTGPNGSTHAVQFAAGETVKYIDVTPVDDADSEPAETVVATVADAGGAAVVGGPATVTVADDSDWHFGGWTLEDGLGPLGNTSLGSRTEEGTDVIHGADDVHRPWTRYLTYVAVDSWRYLGVSDESDNWGDPEDLTFGLTQGNERSVSATIGMSLPEGFEANMTVGATWTTGIGADEEYSAAGRPNTKAFLRGYVRHRQIIQYERYVGGVNRTQEETSSVVLEGDLAGRFECVIWRRSRVHLDFDDPRAQTMKRDETAIGDPPLIP